MPLMIARALALGVAALLIVASAGPASASAFAAADVILALILAGGALLPARWAGPILASGAAYALGVFAISVLGAAFTGRAPALVPTLVLGGALGVLASLAWRVWLSRARN